jgi:mono/diheme cytochrome c family protein
MKLTRGIRLRASAVLIGTIGTYLIGGLMLEGQPVKAQQTITPNYYRDVQPILEQHCISCHVAGGIAPFALTSGKDAVKWADEIARVTQNGYMPPWPPGGDSPAFLNDRRLGAATKQLLVDWAKAGAPLGKQGAGQKP